MSLDDLHRRSLLKGVTASMIGLAGCGGEDQQNNRTKAETRVMMNPSPETTSEASKNTNARSDTETETQDDIVPPHDHSSGESGGSSLRPVDISISEFQQAPSYIVYHRDGQIRALNGQTNEEEFSDSNASPLLQTLIEELSAGTIFVKAGVYEVGPQEVFFQSNIRLVGEGPGATIFRLKDGINGRRGENRSTVFIVGETVSNVTIENLEIDGNESGNREVPGYPLSPHHHGITVHGSSAQVAEDRKPSQVSLRNLYIHDTVRSNIALAGRDGELENLWLSNSATDHWLYLAGASNCNVRNIHVSGMARTSGIVFGVGKRRCFGNTLKNIEV